MSRPPKARTPWGALVLVAVAFYWRWGYAFGTGDHDEMIPQLLRMLDDDLFSRDWYVMGEAGRMTVRLPFLLLLRALCVVLPLEAAVFMLWAATLLALAWGLCRLFLTCFADDQAAAVLGAFAALVVTTDWPLGKNALAAPLIAPEPIAWALALPALVLFAEGRRKPAALLLGVAAWVQLLVGLLTAFALGLLMLWEVFDAREKKRGAHEALVFGLLFFLAASPVFVPTVIAQTGGLPVPDDGLSTWYVIAALRQPHHYLFFSFGPRAWAQAALLATSGTAALLLLQRRGGPLKEGRFVGRSLLVIAGLCGVYLLFTEGLPSLTIAKLQFYKLTVPAQVLLTFAVVSLAWAWLPPRWAARANAWLDRRGLVGAVGFTALAATVGLTVGGVGRPAALWQPARHRASALYAVERWAQDSTATDALFLIPPSETTFRTWARRSVVINEKPTPFRDAAMHERLARLRAVAPAPLPRRGIGFTEAMDDAYYRNTPADWQRLGRQFGTDYALVDTTRLVAPPSPERAFAAGRWAVYRLRR